MVGELTSSDTLQPTQGSLTLEHMQAAILGQESGNRSNVGVSSTGARGPGQIEPGTFVQYAKPGERIDNPDDNRRVSARILTDYMQRWPNDPARVAVAYFSGPGNVAPLGSATPYVHNFHDPSGKTTASYVDDIHHRLANGGVSVQRTNYSGGYGSQNSLLAPENESRQPQGLLDTFGNAVADTAQKQQEPSQAAAPVAKPSGPPIGGVIGNNAPLGLSPQQPTFQPAPRPMDYYLAMLKRQPTETANG